MRKCLIPAVAMLICLEAYAYHFESNGLYYSIGYAENECWLDRNPDDAYSGKISIPSAVTYEGRELNVVAILGAAFYGCENLTAVEIPSSIETIGDQAFAQCTALKSITLPTNLQYVGNQCFSGCSTLKNIYLPGSLTDRIGEYVLSGCNALTDVTIGEGVTLLPRGSFEQCTSLKNVTLPSSLRTIEDNAFDTNPDIETLTMPQGLVSLGRLFGCTGLSTLSLPDGLQHFGGAPGANLTEITLPAGITKIADSAFGGCEKLERINALGSITEIGSSAFNECKKLMTLPPLDNVTTVGRYAFYNCSSLHELIFTDKLTNIGFETGYAEPDGIAGGCVALERAELGHNVKIIPNQCFYGCSSLTNFVVPEACTAIGPSAFMNCESLKSITMPSKMETLGARHNGSGMVGAVFRNCISLTDIVIPEGIETIEQSTFAGCSSLSDLQLPSTLKHIGPSAISGCALRKLNLPNGLESIGNQAIELDNLTELTVPASVTYLDTRWLTSNTMHKLTFEDGPIPIKTNEAAMILTPNLQELYVGRDVETDGNSCIVDQGPKLYSVTLGVYITNAIHSVDFLSLGALGSITAKSLEPPVVGGFTEHHYQHIAPVIDTQAIDAYQADTTWKNFLAFEPENGLNAIEEVTTDTTTTKFYNMSGTYMGDDPALLPSGIYIKRQLNGSTKIRIK